LYHGNGSININDYISITEHPRTLYHGSININDYISITEDPRTLYLGNGL